jgi:hypothetical protein
MGQAQRLDPMAFPELLDALADWTVHHRPSLAQCGSASVDVMKGALARRAGGC